MRKCVILWNQNISESSSKYARKKKIKQKKKQRHNEKHHAQENLIQVDLQQHNFMCSLYLFLSCILRIVALPQAHSTAHIMWLNPLIIQCVVPCCVENQVFSCDKLCREKQSKDSKMFFLLKKSESMQR